MLFNAYNVFHPKATLQNVCHVSPTGWFNALVITVNDTACNERASLIDKDSLGPLVLCFGRKSAVLERNPCQDYT